MGTPAGRPPTRARPPRHGLGHPEARHGHKTAARGFDGDQGHIGVDPDTEIITATKVTPGNAGDGGAATDLIADLIAHTHPAAPTPPDAEQPDAEQPDAEQPSKIFGDCA